MWSVLCDACKRCLEYVMAVMVMVVVVVVVVVVVDDDSRSVLDASDAARQAIWILRVYRIPTSSSILRCE